MRRYPIQWKKITANHYISDKFDINANYYISDKNPYNKTAKRKKERNPIKMGRRSNKHLSKDLQVAKGMWKDIQHH